MKGFRTSKYQHPVQVSHNKMLLKCERFERLVNHFFLNMILECVQSFILFQNDFSVLTKIINY